MKNIVLQVHVDIGTQKNNVWWNWNMYKKTDLIGISYQVKKWL
jgi:hypothetical protein